jgi:succinyl-diaminopimelate desuccinylase
MPEQVAFLAELVKVPSDNPPGDCAPHAARAAELLSAGASPSSARRAGRPVAANGMISATNLVVRRSFGPGPTIALNAHGDVVPPGEGWSVDPYGGVVKDGACMAAASPCRSRISRPMPSR